MVDSSVSPGESSGLKKKSSHEAFLSRLTEFDFQGDSIDMALRKLLARVHLPKETQHIDSVLQEFGKRYCECNPDLIGNPDVVHIVAFSIIILHTDAHSKSVRQKMSKETFTANTISTTKNGFPAELLDIIYDNVVHQRFTFVEDTDEDQRTPEKASWFTRLSKSGPSIQQTVLLEDFYARMTQLMPAENVFRYKRLPKPVNVVEAHVAFSNAQPLRLGGVRNRHSAGNGANQNTDIIRVVKAGIVDRKYDLLQGGKKAAPRGWRTFGVILSGSQLIFFADILTFESRFYANNARTKNVSVAVSRDSADVSLLHHAADIACPSSRSTSPRNTTNPNPSLSPTASNSSRFTGSPSPPQSPSSVTINATPPTTESKVSIDSAPSPTPTSPTTHVPPSSTMLLRPVQIISLADAFCIYDESYTKYPHVFRIIVGDGPQFLIRTETEQELDDWMTKINYVATVKTTGVRLRMTRFSDLIERMDRRKAADRMNREERAKQTIMSLSQNLLEKERALNADLQLRRNLIAMIPLQKTTKERMLATAEMVGKRIHHQRLDIQHLECLREYLERSLHAFSFENAARKISAPLLARGVISGPLLTQRSATSPALQREIQRRYITSSVKIDKNGGVWTDFPSQPDIQIPRRTSSLISATGRQMRIPQQEAAESGKEQTQSPSLGPQDVTTESMPDEGNEESYAIDDTTDPTKDSSTSNYHGEPKTEAESADKSDPMVNLTVPSDTEQCTRRRSVSNPVAFSPNVTDLSLTPSTSQSTNVRVANRARSSSEASSVRDDDDELAVVHMNGSDDESESCIQNWTPA